jgi:activator of HSP90 ATPase
VNINDDPGAEFKAFDGMLTGTILDIIKPLLIVQSWRSAHFKTYDKDSTLILNFSQKGDNGYIDLIHLDVPDHDYDAVTKGWEKYYLNPWREYFQNK